jgi:DNA polymerase-3 subunit gamma/tau
MSYQVLARKWRPKKFEEVVGQEHVTRSLQNALRSGKLAHAYLFTGTRGVGKTSIARLFAKAVRCENRATDMNPCLKCISCKDIEVGNSLDYQEIDGASNNSVDNVRELIENVRYLPARGTKKIYVIDEVHMLSTAAFNALLKTLEEPPEHALFLFATTDPHKLLGTVLSRCHRFDFKSVPTDLLTSHLQNVATKEGIRFSDPRLIRRLASYGKGSVRDALSLFDQVLSLAGEGAIDEAVFFQSLGLARAGAIRDLVGHVLVERPLEASELMRGLLQENIDLKRIVDQVLDAFYEIIQRIDNPSEVYAQDLLPHDSLKGITFAELFWAYETFAKDCEWAMVSPSPEKVVDLILQKIARRRQILQPDRSLVQKETTEPAQKKTPPKPAGPTLNPSFEALVSSLGHEAPTIRANLELGNFIETPRQADDGIKLTIGFPEHSPIAKDYLSDAEVFAKLRSKAADFYGVGPDRLNIKLVTVTQAQMTKMGFQSIHDRDTARSENDLRQRRERLLNDPFVKEAEKLFNAKVDKVVLKDEQ